MDVFQETLLKRSNNHCAVLTGRFCPKGSMSHHPASRDRFILAVILIVVFTLASSAPKCYETSRSSNVCLDFGNVSDFDNYLQRGELRLDLWFYLKDSSLEFLPPSAFVGANLTAVGFSNVRVESYSDRKESPFDALKDTLTTVVFCDNSTLPESWALLSGLLRLETLELLKQQNLNLSRDFNLLPKTVKKLTVVSSTIEYVDDQWLSSLPNLQVVSVRECNLKTFARSMLPNPSTNLWGLDLSGNELTELADDLCEGLPALGSLNVAWNLITSFSKETFSPLNRSGTVVRMTGNPLHCDCKAEYFLGCPDSWLYPACDTPEWLNMRDPRTLSSSQFVCNTTDEDWNVSTLKTQSSYSLIERIFW